MSKVLTIINNKGGTGKTTTSLNLGYAFARMRKRVLLVDLDSQCNLSSALTIGTEGNHIGKLLLKQSSIEETVQYFDQLSLIPAATNLLDYEHQINNEPGREFLLKESIEPLKSEFDYIIFDCPPSLGTLSINSLVASDYFLVPMQAENFAFIGLDKILITAEKVKARLNKALDFAGVLLIRYSNRTKFSKAVRKNLEKNPETAEKLFKTVIRQDIALMESAAFHQSIYEYSPSSRGAEDYTHLANEFLKKYGSA